MEILKRPTLVLNKNWIPISTVTVQDALTMLFGEFLDDKGQKLPKAKVLDVETWLTHSWKSWSKLKPKNELVIHAGRGQEFRVPEIIITTRYQKIPRNQLNFSRKNLFRRDEEKCQYCNEYGDSIDHVFPRSRGGKTSWTNCVCCCFKCNQKKKNFTPEEAGLKLIREPCKPEILRQTQIKIKSWEIFFGKNKL